MRAQDSEGWSQTRKENMPMTIQLYYYSICVKYEALVCLIFCLLVMCTMRAEDSEGWSQTPRENTPMIIQIYHYSICVKCEALVCPLYMVSCMGSFSHVYHES